MAGASEHLGRTLTRFLGAAALGALVKTSLTEFAKVERSWNSLAIMMDNLGISAKENLPAVRKELEALAAAGDGALAETIPAFQTFLGLTKNVAASMELVKLSANIAETGLMDLAGAGNVIENVLSGKATPALRNLGINIRENADGAINAKEALATLFDRFPDHIRDIEDMQSRLDRLTAAWVGFKTALATKIDYFASGEFMEDIRSAVEFLRGGTEKPPALGKVIAGWGAAGKEAGEAFNEGKKAALDVAGTAVSSKDVEAAKRTAEKRREIETQAALKVEELKARLADEGTQERLALELASLDKQKEEAIEAARKVGASTLAIEEAFLLARQVKQKEFRDETAKDAREWNEQFKRESERAGEELARAAAEMVEFERESLDALQQARIAGIQDEIEAAEQRGEDISSLNDEIHELDLARLEEARLAEIAAAQAKGAEVATIEERYRLMKLTAEQKHTRMMDFIHKQRRLQAVETATTAATAAITFAGVAFGESKSLMIAQAIVDTYAAANRALATLPPPFSYAAATLAVAMGMANVKRIKSIEKESGGGGKGGGKGEAFDDPVNDEKAFKFGRKSVVDFIQHTSRGHQQALREVLPSLQTRKGRHFMTDRPEGLLKSWDSGAEFTAAGWDSKKGLVIRRETLTKEIKKLVKIVRDNINAGDPDGGITEALEYFKKLDLERSLAEKAQTKAQERRRSTTGGIPEMVPGGQRTAASDRLSARMAHETGRGSVEAMAKAQEQAQARSQAALASSLSKAIGGKSEPIEKVTAGDAGSAVSGGDDVHIHGNVYGGDAGLRELSRMLERAGRLDRRFLK